MATKKTAVKPETEEIEAAAEAEPETAPAEEAPVDSWAQTEDVVVPRKPKGEDQQFYICVNDRRFMVPANGKVQTLPKPVAEILKASIQAEYAADEFADHIPNESGENPAVHAI